MMYCNYTRVFLSNLSVLNLLPVFAGLYRGFCRFFPTVLAEILFAVAKTQPWKLFSVVTAGSLWQTSDEQFTWGNMWVCRDKD